MNPAINDLFAISVLLAAFVAPVAYLTLQFIKQASMLKAAWKRLSQFEKPCLWAGFIYILVSPIFASIAEESNSLKGLSVVISALAEGIFIVGALAFLKHANEIFQDSNRG